MAFTTLGPCADALGLSIMMTFMLGVAQLPIMIALALHFPSVRVDVFSTSIRTEKDPLTNGTAVIMPPSLSLPSGGAASADQGSSSSYYMHNINISGLFVICAASFTFYVVLTMHIMDRSRAGNMEEEEFVRQNVNMMADPSFRTWNQAFAASILLVHGVVIWTVCSPISLDVLICSFVLIHASLGGMTQPLDNCCRDDDSHHGGGAAISQSMTSQQVMVMACIYACCILLAVTRIVTDEYMAKSQAMLVLACLDAFMLFGHLWDRVPTLQVILNCRLIYIILLAVYNMIFFCSWDPYMKTAFLYRA